MEQCSAALVVMETLSPRIEESVRIPRREAPPMSDVHVALLDLTGEGRGGNTQPVNHSQTGGQQQERRQLSMRQTENSADTPKSFPRIHFSPNHT